MVCFVILGVHRLTQQKKSLKLKCIVHYNLYESMNTCTHPIPSVMACALLLLFLLYSLVLFCYVLMGYICWHYLLHHHHVTCSSAILFVYIVFGRQWNL